MRPPSRGPGKGIGDCRFLWDGRRAIAFHPSSLSVLELPEWASIDTAEPQSDTTNPKLSEWLLSELAAAPRVALRPDPIACGRFPPLTDLSLDISGACNLACRYCFEAGLPPRKGAMSRPVVDAALDFAFGESSSQKSLTLHFGSGEPLLRSGTLEEIAERSLARAGARRRVSIELTTNGTLLTEGLVRRLASLPLRARISIDGPPELHDRQRLGKDGESSSGRVMEGLRLLMENMPDRTTVNAVFCRGEGLLEVWHWAREKGLGRLHVIRAGATLESGLRLGTASLAAYARALSRIARDIEEGLAEAATLPVFQPFAKILRRLVIPQPIRNFCGAGRSYLGIAADGSIYPCFRHLGLKDFCLGGVERGIEATARRTYAIRIAREVDSRPPCASCWARYLCGGGCYADPVVYSRLPSRPIRSYCRYALAEIEESLRLYSRLRRHNPLGLLQFLGAEDLVECGAGASMLAARNCD